MKSHHIFFALMALTSAISLAKSGVLAAVLAATDFAHYSAAFALVGLAASITSFGLAEGTVKQFTRLIAFGRDMELRSAVSADVRTLLRRHLLSLLIVPPAAYVVLGWSSVVPAASVVIFACATNLFAILASLFRGYDRLIDLGIAALIRSICALIAAASVAAAFGWEDGIAAEAAVTVLVAAAAMLYARGVIRRQSLQPANVMQEEAHVAGKYDGFWLFLAFCVGLIPVSLDRAWVVQFAPARDAAQYAFCGIWIVAASTVTGIYAQKFGPDVIRMRASQRAASLLSAASRHAVSLGAILFLGGAAAFLLTYSLLPDVYWYKYHLSLPVALVTLAAVCVQVSALYDWALIALNGERYAFTASCLFTLATMLAFGACALLGLGFLAYMASVAIAKAMQIGTAAFFIARLERTATS